MKLLSRTPALATASSQAADDKLTAPPTSRIPLRPISHLSTSSLPSPPNTSLWSTSRPVMENGSTVMAGSWGVSQRERERVIVEEDAHSEDVRLQGAPLSRQGGKGKGRERESTVDRIKRESQVRLLEGEQAPKIEAELSSSRTYADHDHKPHLTPVFAGLLTVSILGFTIFYLFEVVWAIIFAGVKGRGVLRWIELGCGILMVSGGIMTVAWLRTRRRTFFSRISFFVSIFVGILHILLAAANLLLIYIWRQDLLSRCTWGLDVAWSLGAMGRDCSGRNTILGWTVAGGTRLLVTLIAFGIQFTLLLRFYHSQAISTSPSLFHTRAAPPVPLEVDESSSSFNPNALPHMPDRRAAQFSEVTATTFDSTAYQKRSFRLRQESPTSGVGTWLGAKVLGAVSYLFGMESYENRKLREQSREGRRGGSDMEERRLSWHVPRPSRGEVSEGGESGSGIVYNTAVDLDEPPTPSTSNIAGLGTTHILSSIREVVGRDNTAYQILPLPLSHDELPPSSLPFPSTHSYSQSLPHQSSYYPPETEYEYLQNVTASHEPYQSAPSTSHHEYASDQIAFGHSATGSSGSTNGSIVYVRMSDGKLVRKLSTIRSVGSVRTGSEASAAGSGRGGRGRGSSRGSTSDGTFWEGESGNNEGR